ncbi:MAG: glycerol-3-phosphate 1-O-acyltransferase PlsB, partial [Pseudomonadota bacterium]
FLIRRPGQLQTSQLQQLVQHADQNNDWDAQLVPVSIFWGTAPGRERSAFKGLFSESWELAGRTKRFFTILFNGRRTFLQLGAPLSVNHVVEEGLDTQRTVRKISRVLRVHFRQVKEATLGPDLSHKRNLITEILQSKAVRRAVRGEAASSQSTTNQTLRKASKYAHEIAADYSDNFVRFMYRVLTWLWNRLYNGVELTNLKVLQDVVQGHEVVYVPCHRSHIDYLLMSFVLFENKLALPHIAAGINLNLPVIGPLLRRGGAFFIRRSFKGNKLYSAVFSQYVAANLSKGVALEFFVEGGRSRTGRLLKPKQGMLSMVVRSHVSQTAKPVVFIPVHIAYERLLEGRTYLGELGGAQKKRESVFDIFKIFKAIRKDYGKVHLNFGQPIFLEEYLSRYQPDWRAEDQIDRPHWIGQAVDDTAQSIMVGINNAAVVTPINLVATALLATPNQALGEKELLSQIDLLLAVLKEMSPFDALVVSEWDAKKIIEYAEGMGQIKRKPHDLGDILFMEGRDAILMTYYSNNVLHLFALASLVACVFLNNAKMPLELIQRLCRMVYPYISSELFLPWKYEEVNSAVEGIVECFVEQKLLSPEDKQFRRPSEDTRQAAQLSMLAQSVLQTIERFYLVIAVLAKHGSGKLSQRELENLCHGMAQRISTLYKIDAPEFFDKALFSSFIDNLQSMAVVKRDDQGLLAFDQEILSAAIRDARSVLSAQIRHSILQIISY